MNNSFFINMEHMDMKLKKILLALLITLSLSTTVIAQEKVDINTATQTQLETLNGIGATTAAAIIEYRKEHGAYQRTEDLVNVKGIGVKKFMRISDSVMASNEQKQ